MHAILDAVDVMLNPNDESLIPSPATKKTTNRS
jgi:hypothetical protein